MQPKIKKSLEKSLPAVLYRNNPRFRELTGLAPGTIRNLERKGQGPAERVQNGKLVGYPRAAVIDFLARRMKGEADEP